MRKGLIVLAMLLCSITSAAAQVSIGIGLPGASIGINLPVYPTLARVPGYPVYYAPQLNSNYFFYDGMYWVYEQDSWYASSWYNGPWVLVSPAAVPLFLLRVPVRYYRRPPPYFYGWRSEAPPRWGEHWGNAWEHSHSGWDKWNRSAVPAPAPLPTYQRQYSGNRYPHAEQQQQLQSQNYRYRPYEAVVQQHYQAQGVPSQPASSPPGRQGVQHSPQRGAAPTPRQLPPQIGGVDVQKADGAKAPTPQGHPTAQLQGQQPHRGPAQREHQAPTAQVQAKGPQGKPPAMEPRQSHEQRGGTGQQPGGERNQ